jgi:predicted PurR-regulated permease PerM
MAELFILTFSVLMLLVFAAANLVLTIWLFNKINTLMATVKEQFDALNTRLNEATNRIAERLEALEETVQNMGLTAEQEQQILATTEPLIAQLEALGRDPENPIPENPETPVS